MNIIFYSVYDKINQRDLDILKVNVYSYDRTNTQKVKWIIFYFEEPCTVLDIRSKNITFIFKKIRFFKNALNFRQKVIDNYINKANVSMLVDCFSYKIKALEILSRTHKFDLICHVDFDLIFIKDISEIFEHAIASDKTVFGTALAQFKKLPKLYEEFKYLESLNVDEYLNTGFTIFKPQRVYKSFLSSEFLGYFCLDELFFSKYSDFENVKNLQLIFDVDDPNKYYIVHFSKCGLSSTNECVFMRYYYKLYKQNALISTASKSFKDYIMFFWL